MKSSLLALAVLASASCAAEETVQPPPAADVIFSEIEYEVEGTPLTGYIAMPGGLTETRPGVLVVHEWWGHNDYVRMRARQLAEMGYVAFALDMYGDGKLATHPSDAQGFAQEVMGNRDRMIARFQAALDVLKGQSAVDDERVGAIGYCMGGAIALDMALSGQGINAVASFHGSLPDTLSVQGQGTETRVLVCTGADDPFVPAENVEALRSKLDAAGSNFEIVAYEGVLHGFTNPMATAKGEEHDLPLRYDAEADADSWARMTRLFAETL